MNTCNALREARHASGLTFREVSAASGLTLTALARYELGRRIPAEGALIRWRDALRQLMATRAASILDTLAKN